MPTNPVTEISSPNPINRARIAAWVANFYGNWPRYPRSGWHALAKDGSRVRCKVSLSGEHMYVRYKGTLADMLAEGAIDSTTFEALSTLKKGGNQHTPSRKDQHGNPYRIVRKAAGVPEGEVTLYIRDKARAVNLPGVLDALAELYAQIQEIEIKRVQEPILVRRHLSLVWVNPTI